MIKLLRALRIIAIKILREREVSGVIEESYMVY
jgi:hypothetical protein